MVMIPVIVVGGCVQGGKLAIAGALGHGSPSLGTGGSSLSARLAQMHGRSWKAAHLARGHMPAPTQTK